MERGAWFPTIYSDHCNSCTGLEVPRCVQYCPNRVFTLQDNLVVVTNPHNCIYLCTSCKPVCPKKAIVFPKRTSTPTKIKTVKKELIRKTKCHCGKIFWTNRETNVCLDCEKKEY